MMHQSIAMSIPNFYSEDFREFDDEDEDDCDIGDCAEKTEKIVKAVIVPSVQGIANDRPMFKVTNRVCIN